MKLPTTNLDDCNGGAISSFFFLSLWVVCYILSTLQMWSVGLMLLEEEMIPPLEQWKKRLRRVTLLKPTGPGWHRGTTWSCCLRCLCRDWACGQGQRCSSHRGRAQLPKDPRRLCICCCWESYGVKTGICPQRHSGWGRAVYKPFGFVFCLPCHILKKLTIQACVLIMFDFSFC